MKAKASPERRRKLFLELEKWVKELERQQREWRTGRQEEEEEKEEEGRLEARNDK